MTEREELTQRITAVFMELSQDERKAVIEYAMKRITATREASR